MVNIGLAPGVQAMLNMPATAPTSGALSDQPLIGGAISPPDDRASPETIDFEAGVALLNGVLLLPPRERAGQLDKARNDLQRFLAEHPQHPWALRANIGLAGVAMEQARRRMADAHSATTPDQKQRLLTEARELYRSAQRIFTSIDAELAEGEKRHDFGDNNVEFIARRDEADRDALITRFAVAKMPYEIAQTFEPGSRENREYLTEAATKLGRYGQTYKPQLAAAYARLDEARCYHELGDEAKALAVRGEAIADPRLAGEKTSVEAPPAPISTKTEGEGKQP